jgi:hypothetical protein
VTSALGVVTDHREQAAGQPLPEVGVEAVDGLAEDDRRGLAERPRRATGRELEADHERPGIEGRAAGGQPPRVPMHREQLGAAPYEPERDVEVAVRQVVARVADDDGRDRALRRGLGSIGVQEGLVVELATRVLGGEHERRPSG